MGETEATPPMVVFIGDCSTSTSLIGHLRNLLRTTCHVNTTPTHYEYFHKTRFKQWKDKLLKSMQDHPESQLAIKLALHPGNMKRLREHNVLREVGAHAEHVYRGQLVDRLVCDI